MAFLRIEVSGLAEAQARLEPAVVKRALQVAMREIGARALPLWRNATPRRTGRLRWAEHVVPHPTSEFGLQFRVREGGFYYGPVNARRGMTDALLAYLGSGEVLAIIERHLAAALGGE